MAEGPVIAATQKAWRKIQDGVWQGYNFACVETSKLQNISTYDKPYSFRENTVVLDLNEEAGVATIGEGDYEAEEGSVGLEEGTLGLSHFNARFNISKLQRYADRGMENQLERDLKLRASKKMQAMARHEADYFYGSSSATLALCDLNISSASTATLTLKSGYGNTGITDPAFLARKFAPQVNSVGGDVIALVNSSSLVANSFARVTARDLTAGTITVAFATACTINATNLKIVKANSTARNKITPTISHTDYNRGLVGLQDILFASSLHGLTHANWAVAYSDSSAVRFTGTHLQRADDEIGNWGQAGAKADMVFIDQAVRRDMVAYERAAVRFAETFGMEVDGSIKSKGRTFFDSPRVPPGYVVPMNSKGLKKWEVKAADEGTPQWADGKEYIDLSGMVFGIDRVVGLVVPNRQLWTVFTGKTRS